MPSCLTPILWLYKKRFIWLGRNIRSGNRSNPFTALFIGRFYMIFMWFGGTIGFVGSGIHVLNSQIKSKSLRNEFEKRILRGTRNWKSSSEGFQFLVLTLHRP